MATQVLTFYRTTIGKKAVMAVSGAVLLGFLISHMLGNLQVFLGPEAINGYARMLREFPGLLWAARLGLLAALIAHVWSAVALAKLNRGARSNRYQRKEDLRTNIAAKSMFSGGLVIFFFLLYHLGHLTLGVVGPEGFEHLEVYNNVIIGFQVEWLTGLYVVAQLALGLHLYHGSWSFMQTLGLSHPRFNPWRKRLAVALAVIIPLGFIAVPVAVLAGFLQPV